MIAAIYARKSTEQTGIAADQKSVTRQIEHAKAYAARKGWRVTGEYVFVDDGISGAEFTNRPGFMRLMNALKPRAPFQALIMSEESRLGREQIATGYALQQIITAGVRVFLYMEDRERTLNSPIEKVMLSLQTMGDEMEREKARQRAIDTAARKAKAGEVTGGRTFGYDNICSLCRRPIPPGAKRCCTGARTEHRVNDAQAAVVRRIFEWSADGLGAKTITKRLNAEGLVLPRRIQGRSPSWAPTTVRSVLFRPLYRGEIVWNQTRNCDQWGQVKRGTRPRDEWIRVPAPELRIVSEDLWIAAHAQKAASRAIYRRDTNGRPISRPPLGNPSKYLLTHLAQCGVCGSSLRMCSRSRGTARARFYGCSGYHDRGRTVCPNGADIPIAEADRIVIETLLKDLLDQSMLDDAVTEALSVLQGDELPAREDAVRRELKGLEGERANLVRAIAAGGELDDLLLGLQARDQRRVALELELTTLQPHASLAPADVRRVRRELSTLAAHWRQTLLEGPEHARPIVASLLRGRVTFTPLGKPEYELRGTATYAGLFARVFSAGGISRTGTETGGTVELFRRFRAA